MRFAIVLAVILIKNGAFCEDTEAEFRRLPKLYHLDDFEKCMARKDGLFCLGQFEIYSDIENNPLYDLIREKSQERYVYNRSYLHRGYCLPTRCPSREANASARFERCVDAWARGHSLRARLHTLHYCRAHGQPPPVPSSSDIPHRVFLYVVYAYLFMNALGTLYDVKMGRKGNKNNFLMMFSLRVNWLRLTAVNEVKDVNLRGLKVLNGLKACLLLGAVVAHVGVVIGQAWQYNPRFMEKFLSSSAGGIIGALTTLTQTFVLISTFLTTYNLLLFSEKRKIGFSMIPLIVLKRLIRMLPVYLLVNGFSATWWTKFGDGPTWPLLVGTESKVCREKFWLQAFFLQNVFEPNRICNVQTWVMAVDIQLFIPSLVIIILLKKYEEWATQILFALLAGVTALTGHVALTRHYIPAFNYMTPENFRTMFYTERNLVEFFVKPINCVITMVLGILIGYKHYNMRQQGASNEKKMKPSKVIVVAHWLSFPMAFLWSYFCAMLRPINNPMFMALMMPIERLACALFGIIIICTVNRVKSLYTDVLTWSGLRVLSRLSMSISMVHWSVNMILVANRSTLLDSSHGMLLLDTIGVAVISFILAIPLTLIVEYPTTKIMDKILSI